MTVSTNEIKHVMISFLVFLGIIGLVHYALPDIQMPPKPFAAINHKDLTELSGVIRSGKSGEYWCINDSGNLPALYRFTLQGKIIQTVFIDHVINEDWEAITSGGGNLYIGDIGDNDQNRKKYSIYRMPQLGTSAKKITAMEHFHFQYPKGESYNCEALFFYHNALYLISKEPKKNENPTLFRLSSMDKSKTQTAKKVGKINLESRVSDAAVSDNGLHLAILTDDYLYLSNIQSEKDMLNKPTNRIKIDFGNCEGLCFDEENLVITNESGKIWLLKINDLFALAD